MTKKLGAPILKKFFDLDISILIWILYDKKMCNERFVSYRTEFSKNRDVTLFFIKTSKFRSRLGELFLIWASTY